MHALFDDHFVVFRNTHISAFAPYTMELIGAGCGRTGTLSLKTALEILGLPCYHMVTVIERGDVGLCLDAAEGKAVDFTSVLDGCGAVCDWPANYFYKQLMETYPDAKVILTVRDPAKWYASVRETVWAICRAMSDAPGYVKLIDGIFPPGRKMGPMMDKVLWQGIMQGTFEDPAAAQQRYREWNDEVKQHVAPEKLLVFEPSQGWEPLCKFLGRPVPEQPFPHVNDTQEFKNMVAGVRTRLKVIQYGVVAAVAGLGCCALLLTRRGS